MREAGARNLPFRALVAFALVSPLSIAATNAAWVAALLLWIYVSWRDRFDHPIRFPRTDLDPAPTLLILASAMSVWTAVNPGASLLEFRSLGFLAICYLFAWHVLDASGRGKIVLCLLASASLAAAYGIFQSYTGWDFLGHFQPETGKASGFFSLHLTFGEYLVMTTCVAVGAVLWAGRPKRAAWAAGVPAALLMAFALLRSGAKGALLGLLAGLGVLLALRGRRAFLKGAVALVLVCALLFALPGSPPFRTVLALFGVDAEHPAGPMTSNTQRLFMWWSGFRISLGHLLHGVGLHGVDAVYPSFRHPLAIDPNQWHLHNNFIQLGVETGLFGLAAFLYLFLMAFREGFRRLRLGETPLDRGLAAGVVAAMTGFLVSGLTEYSWGDSEVLLCLYMLLGLVISVPVRGEESAGRLFEGPAGCEEPCSRGLAGRAAQLLLAAALLVLASASVLLPSEPTAARERILGAAAGCGLAWIALRRPSPGKLPAPWTGQLAGCLVAFSGHAFARTLHAPADAFPEPALGASVAAALLAAALVAAMLAALAALVQRGRERMTLFDLAVLGAPLLWALLCVATNLLLGAARIQQAFLAPPFGTLLALCGLTASLYAAGRFSFRGDPLCRTVIGLAGLGLVIQALRG